MWDSLLQTQFPNAESLEDRFNPLTHFQPHSSKKETLFGIQVKQPDLTVPQGNF